MIRDFLLHGSNTVLMALACLILGAAGCGAIALNPVWIGLGALLFYGTEYGTHRFLFHAPPSRFAWLRRKQHRLHYDHHLEPARLDLLFLPLWYVLPNMLLLVAIGWAVLPNAGAVCGVVLGSVLALLHYEWVHYVAHVPYTPRTPAGRWMKRYHLKHHFVNERLWFGVSNPSMDMLYRTYTDGNPGARSRTTRILYPAGK